MSGGASARRTVSRALGGISAQGTQAATSLVLQVIAARALGAAGLGWFAALQAFIVLATGISSGFVGDSLTVLDRTNSRIRAGLQAWWLLIGAGVGIVFGAVGLISGFLSESVAGAFALAGAMFVLEDALRRLLMACLYFWRVVIVDLAGLAASILYLVVIKAAGQDLGLADLLFGLAAGQLIAMVVATTLLPRNERVFARMKHADLAVVFGYGKWRALQQAVRPAVLAGVKVAAVVIAGAVLAGQLEAARIIAAPALLIVSGATSVLFAWFAASRGRPPGWLLRRADLGVIALCAAVALYGMVALMFRVPVEHILTDGDYQVSSTAMIGWLAFALAVAATTPYGALCAVKGRQAAVFGYRLIDSAASIGLALTALSLHRVDLVPMGLATGTAIGALLLRRLAHTIEGEPEPAASRLGQPQPVNE